jgi:hypothetical protein
MRTAARWTAILALGAMAAPAPTAAATPEQIGSWVLTCSGEPPRSGPCLMRLNKRFLDKAGITADLEVQASGTSLVPVITLRGLSHEVLTAAALAGTIAAAIQFSGGSNQTLACTAGAAGYICAPDAAAGERLAAELPLARSVTVLVSVSVTGMNPLPPQAKSMDLTGTAEALVRLRSAGPTQVPGPLAALTQPTPAGLIGMADKALKAAGYPNGVADLQALVAKYMRK